MLLNHFLLGALLALSSVAALPNPDADIHDIEARDDIPDVEARDDIPDVEARDDNDKDKHGGHHFRCPKDAFPTGNREKPCVCKDKREVYDKNSNQCVCKPDMIRRHHKCVCKDKKKKFRDGKCRCKDDMWEDRWGNCRCPKRKHWDDKDEKCKRDHHY